MENDPHDSVLRQIQTLYSVGTFTGLGDGQLLERFATLRGDAAELAFAALVERHGPMVVRVCRRILKNADDTQDAFQATFLVLVRKGRTLRNRDSVGNWLYGVAFRIAIDARASSRRRQAHERLYARGKHDEVLAHGDDLDRSDLATVLDEELARLPDRYREPIVLCHLQGLTHEEAAHRLGWPVGTVRSRLARGRERLRGRLLRRGLVLPAGALTGATFEEASGAVAESLAELTIRSAAQYAASPARGSGALISAQVVQLIEGVMKSMFLNTLKTPTLCLIAGCLLASGAAVVALEAGTAQDEPRPASTPDLPQEPVQAKSPAGEPVLNQLKGQSKLLSILPNKTKVKKGQLICEFDSSKFEDELPDQTIRVSVAQNAYESARLAREVAEIAVREYTQGVYKLQMQEIRGEIAVAEGRRAVAEEEYTALKKDHKESDLVVRKARQKVNRATIALESAHSKKSLLERFTYELKFKEFRSNVEKCRMDELTNETKWDLEKKKLEALDRAIQLCKIYAAADGVVILDQRIDPAFPISERQVLFHLVTADQPSLPK
jgi:HlyD family secretion protein